MEPNSTPAEPTLAPEEVKSPTLSEQQINAAATNSPQLSPDEFVLGERTFKVLHLPYDDYLTFLSYLQPFIDGLFKKFAKDAKVSIPGIELGESLDAGTLLSFCGKSLPEMTRLVCKQTAPEITAEEIKQMAGNPFVLAGIVLKQVAKNGMIRDFANFFAQVAPLLKAVK